MLTEINIRKAVKPGAGNTKTFSSRKNIAPTRSKPEYMHARLAMFSGRRLNYVIQKDCGVNKYCTAWWAVN